MELAPTIQLTDPEHYPDEGMLKAALRDAFPAYLALLNLFEVNGMSWEWRYYRDSKAWLCKVQKKRRTIVWISAWTGFVQATIYVPERLNDGLYDLPLGDETKRRIHESKAIGKSTPCTFAIREQAMIDEFNTVLQFKLAAG